MEGSLEEISPRGGAAGVPDTAAGRRRTDEPLLPGRVPLRARDTGAAPPGDRQVRVAAPSTGSSSPVLAPGHDRRSSVRVGIRRTPVLVCQAGPCADAPRWSR